MNDYRKQPNHQRRIVRTVGYLPSCYYDPTGLVQKDDRAAHGDYNARKRHYHFSEKGRIVRFMVQLEIRHDQSWREVVRYDCAHGFVHKDIFNLKRVNKKMDIALDYEEALTFADGDIDDNWEIYREKFLGGGFP